MYTHAHTCTHTQMHACVYVCTYLYMCTLCVCACTYMQILEPSVALPPALWAPWVRGPLWEALEVHHLSVEKEGTVLMEHSRAAPSP